MTPATPGKPGPPLWVGLVVLGLGGVAHANPASLVASAADQDDPIDLHLRLDYEYSVEHASIWRERVGAAAGPLDPIPKIRDLAFKQNRHQLTPRADLGVLPNTSLYAALPIIISQQRDLTLGEGVTRIGSTTLADGLLPMGGFDAKDPGTPLPGDGVFRSPSRSGLDQIHVGGAIALMNQDNDDTKPTWKIGGELRAPIGRVMRFDRADPSAETGVGRGVYEARAWMSFARRYRRTEAWLELYWQTPIAEKDTSLLRLPEAERFGATNIATGQRAGVAFGLEAYAYDDAANHNRISLDLGARADAHFEGRDYSELWEVFAYAGDASDAGGPLVLDADPTATGVQARSHTGVTNIENYLELAGRAALRAQLGSYVRFAAMLDLVWKTDHAITFADAGVDLPTCGAGVTGDCENENNGVVNPGTREINPLHVPRIDLVGHRYHSEDNFGFVVGVQGQVLF